MVNKNYYYVLVCTESGPKFVTKTEGKTAYWGIDNKPKVLTKSMAEEIVVGLSWNGFAAYVIQNKFELDYHPYNYKDYEINFVKKESEE